VLARKRRTKSVDLEKARRVLGSEVATSAVREGVSLGDQMYDQAYPHPRKVHEKGEADINYEPNVERDARNEIGK